MNPAATAAAANTAAAAASRVFSASRARQQQRAPEQRPSTGRHDEEGDDAAEPTGERDNGAASQVHGHSADMPQIVTIGDALREAEEADGIMASPADIPHHRQATGAAAAYVADAVATAGGHVPSRGGALAARMPSEAAERPSQDARGLTQARVGNGEMLPVGPGVPDSEPHTVKFLGVLPVEATRDRLPGGETCVQSILRLQSRWRRDRYREGVCKWLSLQVSCGRGLLLCAPVESNRNKGLRVPLHQVVCVADYHEYVCLVTGRGAENGVVHCKALVFQCDTHDASAYIGAELVTACRTIIDELRAARARVRDQQLPARAVTLPSTATDGSRPRPRPNAATNASVSNTPSEPGAAERQREGRKAKRRARSSEPSTSDRLLYASASVYERAVAQGMREASEDPLWMHLMRPRCPTGAKASRGPQSVAKPGATSPPLAAGATSPRRVVCVKPANAVDSPTVGDRVQVQSFGSGILRFHGPSLLGGDVVMIGVELDEPRGNCDGSLAGHGRYFVSEPRRGLMFSQGTYIVTLETSSMGPGSGAIRDNPRLMSAAELIETDV